MNSPIRINDREVLKSLIAGNEQAFKEIYEAYHGNLYLYAYKLVEDTDEAEDIVQEVFVYLWEKRATIHINQVLLPYLYQCVRHRFLNLIDHEKVKKRFVEHFRLFVEADFPAVDLAMEEKELISKLDAFVARQSKKMGMVFSLKHQGFTNEEIAERLHVSVKTVKNLSSEAVWRLKGKIKSFYMLFFLLKMFLYQIF